MGLYTRAEYEEDIRIWDSKEAGINRLLLAGILNGFQAMQAQREIDAVKRALAGKLLSTRMILQDQERMKKSFWFAWVGGAWKEHLEGCGVNRIPIRDCSCKGQWNEIKGRTPRIRHQSREWKETTVAWLNRLAGMGVTLIQSKGRRREEDPEAEWEALEEVEAVEALPEEREISLQEADVVLSRGGSVLLRPNGRECALTRDWAMLENPNTEENPNGDDSNPDAAVFDV